MGSDNGRGTAQWLSRGERLRRVMVALVLAGAFLPLPRSVGPAAAAGPCDAPANDVVAENRLAGSPASVWDVTGAGDPSIQGFATDISVNDGGTVHFHVDCGNWSESASWAVPAGTRCRACTSRS